MIRALLVLTCAFAALSSSVAIALGLEQERIVVFSALVAGLCLLPYLQGAPLPRPGTGLLCLFLLLLAIAVQDGLVGTLDPLDYKVALLLLVLLAAPGLAAELGETAMVRMSWALLALYVAVTFTYQLVAEPAAIARGYAGIVRYDVTGSVVMHASLGLVCVVVALARAASGERLGTRCLGVAVAAMALVTVLETATRTVVLTLALFAVFHLATAENWSVALVRLLAAACGLGLVFALYSALWNPNLLLRLGSTDTGDYGSGRLPSLAWWLGLMGDHPFGLGFGAVRELMADGKPFLEGESTLEWPHNEFVRFYVEAGPLGLAFILLLVGLLVRTALVAAAMDPVPERRALLLVIAADIVAESCLQNLFNAIHHATVLVLFLAAAAMRARSAAGPRVGSGQAALPVPS